MNQTLLVRSLEAILFLANDPITLDRLVKVFEPDEVSADEVREALDRLGRDYVGRGVELRRIGNGYQMRTSPELADYISRLDMPRPAKLSQAAMEALAIIAYRQPVTRADVEDVRGVDCGGVVRSLQERGIIRVVGKKDVPGRPLLYGTTKKFLEVFGLSTLNDLPTLRQIEEFAPAEEEEMEASPPKPEPPAAPEPEPMLPLDNDEA